MKSKYKWPCDICKSFTNEFQMIGERLVCPSCMKKTGGKMELKTPIQTSIFEFLEDKNRRE